MGCVVNSILTKIISSICWMWFELKTFYERNEQHTDHYFENEKCKMTTLFAMTPLSQ